MLEVVAVVEETEADDLSVEELLVIGFLAGEVFAEISAVVILVAVGLAVLVISVVKLDVLFSEAILVEGMSAKLLTGWMTRTPPEGWKI